MLTGAPARQAGAPASVAAAPAATSALPTAPPGSTTPSAPAPGAQAGPARTPTAAAPVRLDYPAAGASVAVHPLTPTAADLAAHALEPPEMKDAYWLTNYGQPGAGSTDTTYIVAHRWVGADAPFNHIGEKAKTGDTFTLTTVASTLRYRVTSVQEIGKPELATSPIWTVTPDRVILITCDFSDPWGKNTVITADPTP